MKFLTLHFLRAQSCLPKLFLNSFHYFFTAEFWVCWTRLLCVLIPQADALLLTLHYCFCLLHCTNSKLLVRKLRMYFFNFAMTFLTIWKWHSWRCRKAPTSHSKLNKAVMKPSSRKSPLSQKKKKTKLGSNTSVLRWEEPETRLH